MRNRHLTNIHRLREEIYAPKNLHHLRPPKWRMDHDSVAIEAYQNMPNNVVKQMGLWIFPNNIRGSSPDRLMLDCPHDACAVGIIEVKCPYSLRDVKIEYSSERHHHLPYLDCNNELKKTHDYYSQIKRRMAAVGVDWCDFVICSPSNIKVHRIFRDHGWTLRYIPQLESFYKPHIVRKGDFDGCDSDEAVHHTDLEPCEP